MVSVRARSGRLRAGLVLVGLGVMLVAGPAPGEGRSAAASGLIAFVRDDGVYVMRADGTGIRPLRRGRQWTGAPAWSPDGRRLALVAGGAVWVMNADGSDPVRITEYVQPKFGLFIGWISPTWSPDGRRIAYTYTPTLEVDRDVWVMNADGSGKHRLVKTPGCAEVGVDWSPTGGRLVTTCVFGWGEKDLRLMTLKGKVVVFVRSQPPNGTSAPDWSSDGRRIAFAEFTPHASGISVIDAANASYRQLIPPDGLATDPSWSPDGQRIVFARFAPDGGIYVMNADGSGVKRLTRDGRAPAWQPRPPRAA